MGRGEMISIGDVSKLFEIPVHTVRYWEQEFEEYLCPERTQGKQRRYAADDIQRLLNIRDLLWNKGYSIRAARIILSSDTDTASEAVMDEGGYYKGIGSVYKNIVNNLFPAV